MMRYSLFIGCQIPSRVQQYDAAARAVLGKLGVELTDIRQFNCCGYPMRNVDKMSFLLSAVRNLALSEQQGLDMLVLCNCCYGALKNAEHMINQQGPLQQVVLEKLRQTGLEYQGKVRIRHYLSVLYHEIGLETVKKRVRKTYSGLNIAVQYGCHLLRPGNITQFDNPAEPTIFDELVAATGAESVDWTNKLECCGAPLMGINDELSTDLAAAKINQAIKAQAAFFCTSCPYCQIQFDHVQQMMVPENPGRGYLPSILFPQLLGLSMDIDAKTLGIGANRLDISTIESYFSKDKE